MTEDRNDARTGYWKHTIACHSHVGDACNCGLEREMLGRIMELEAAARTRDESNADTAQTRAWHDRP